MIEVHGTGLVRGLQAAGGPRRNPQKSHESHVRWKSGDSHHHTHRRVMRRKTGCNETPVVLPERSLQSPGFSKAFSLAISRQGYPTALMSAATARARPTFVLSGTDIHSRTARALAPVWRGPLEAGRMQARASAHRAPCVLSDICRN